MFPEVMVQAPQTTLTAIVVNWAYRNVEQLWSQGFRAVTPSAALQEVWSPVSREEGETRRPQEGQRERRRALGRRVLDDEMNSQLPKSRRVKKNWSGGCRVHLDYEIGARKCPKRDHILLGVP
ncbi:hypothetical protein CKAH01_09153 [Colletotrichum kahawae]|uniref:Uncharacterized protein n=1 Tax=Colletotrichum kahawae TaxID=34407 RepID=A0AAD9Y0Q2_COLKA|nr:hypothetical protein CKAH01_09153 [Colletotrichum kahawae]